MNCFQVIKSVLDEAYGTIPGSDEKKDESIMEQFEILRQQYGDLNGAYGVDYCDSACRNIAPAPIKSSFVISLFFPVLGFIAKVASICFLASSHLFCA